MIALVLAAGLGTRFRPATLTTPKPLLPFLSRPILFHLFDHLLRRGASSFVLNTHHLPEVLRHVVGTSYAGRPVVYSHEPRILGTAGAIRQAVELGLVGREPFLVGNGDVFTTLPVDHLEDVRARSGAVSALGVLPNDRPEVDTPLWADSRGNLVGVGAKPEGDEVTGPWLFTGFQATTRALAERIPPGPAELAKDVLIPSARERDGAFALVPFPEGSFWFDLGTPERLTHAERAVRGQGEAGVHD